MQVLIGICTHTHTHTHTHTDTHTLYTHTKCVHDKRYSMHLLHALLLHKPQVHATCVQLARTSVCMVFIAGKFPCMYTVVYNVYVQFWPTPYMAYRWSRLLVMSLIRVKILTRVGGLSDGRMTRHACPDLSFTIAGMSSCKASSTTGICSRTKGNTTGFALAMFGQIGLP